MLNEYAFYCDTTSHEIPFDDSGWWDKQRRYIVEFYTVEDAKELVDILLSNYGEDGLEDHWSIGKGVYYECTYPDIESFKADVNWEKLVEIVKKSWEKVCGLHE